MKTTNTEHPDSHGNGSGFTRTPVPQRKGKQEANVQKRGSLYFQIGLILSLILVYAGLEMYFSHQQQSPNPPGPIPMETLLIETAYEWRAPAAEVVPQEKKIARARIFTEVPDAEPVKGVIESPGQWVEPDLDTREILYLEPNEPEEYLFPALEDAPIFPGCEAVLRSERLSCFEEKLAAHIRANFRYPEREQELRIQGKVYVSFRILPDGEIGDIQLRGPSSGLEAEAQRIIEKLPKMTPGKQSGRPVRVPFSVPISFKLQ